MLMLVAGDIGHDSRVRRSARSLAASGFDVTVSVAMTANGAPPLVEQDGYRVVHMPVIVPPDELRAVRLDEERARAERKALTARVNGSHPSAAELDRIADLRREEEKLRRRAEFLAEDRRAFKRLDRPYRASWVEVVRREGPDVVHVHDYHGLGAAVKAAGPRTRLVFDAHEHALGKVAGSRRKALALYLRKHAAMVDAVVTVGKELGNVLARDLRLSQAPMVLHNAPSMRDRRPAPYDLRAAAGIDPATPLVVYSGSQSKRRSLDVPIRALSALPGVHLAFVFAVDKMSAQLAEVADREGVLERVHFLPPVAPDAVISLLGGADVAVNPLRPHRNGDLAMPNKLFEYLHAGVPMVVSDSPAMAHFVRKLRLGEVASSDGPEAWARAIERVLSEPEAYAGDPQSRAELRRDWSWEAQEAKLLKLYQHLLATTEDAWYDRVFETSVKYRVRYQESDYFDVWQVVAARLRSLGAQSVLDIGCGPGQFASLLRDSGLRRYLGIDFSTVAVKRAHKVCPEFEFRVDDARTSDAYETYPYDVAVCLETLEHIDQDLDVMRRFRPGARLLATVPDFDYASHVRYFANAKAVRKRYAAAFSELDVTPLPFGRHTLFLLDGVTAGSAGPTGSRAVARRLVGLLRRRS